jgi:CHAT domain-containing protein
VLADPAIPEKLRRRHPELASLAETRLEAERVLARWPGAVCLSGAEARRDAVLESWSRAPRIYVASHTVHVPEIPFITFIPLAAAGPAPLSDGYLEVGDIRSIDLTGCERVVLSACSSGRRWVGERPMSPSLGDAFLDSGAGLVASTLRPIEDLRAREAMEPVLDEWSRSDADPVAGFLRAIRRTIERRGESGNPRAWATWNLTRSGWPRAADGAIARHSGASAAARF